MEQWHPVTGKIKSAIDAQAAESLPYTWAICARAIDYLIAHFGDGFVAERPDGIWVFVGSANRVFLGEVAERVGAPCALELPGAVLKSAFELVVKEESLAVDSGVNGYCEWVGYGSGEVGTEDSVCLDRGTGQPEGQVVAFGNSREVLLAHEEFRGFDRQSGAGDFGFHFLAEVETGQIGVDLLSECVATKGMGAMPQHDIGAPREKQGAGRDGCFLPGEVNGVRHRRYLISR